MTKKFFKKDNFTYLAKDESTIKIEEGELYEYKLNNDWVYRDPEGRFKDLDKNKYCLAKRNNIQLFSKSKDLKGVIS